MRPNETDEPHYQLTSVEIVYSQDENPHLLKIFFWEDYDLAPDYPELHRFLGFWNFHVGGTVHSVRVADLGVPRPVEMLSTPLSLTVH